MGPDSNDTQELIWALMNGLMWHTMEDEESRMTLRFLIRETGWMVMVLTKMRK